GQVKNYQGHVEFIHPEYEPLDDDADPAEVQRRAARPVPVYPATQKLPTWKLQSMVRLALEPLRDDEVGDVLPAEVRRRRNLPHAADALRMIRDPADDQQWRTAHKRRAYAEAFLMQSALARRRAAIAARDAMRGTGRQGGLLSALDADLPF